MPTICLKTRWKEMARWKRDYPEAFARKIDPAAGVCLAGWLEDPDEAN